jgi:uncharacterized membrane-anchored protein YjiN (DUF445 family)
MARRIDLLSPADLVRLRGLRRMKLIALGALLFMTLLFAIGFWLQGSYEWASYLRAFGEGGMVGALADWFAVTAIFRHPFGIPIPHTAIIPKRKDEIGRSLGEFVETNFLASDVVKDKLARTEIARKAGQWAAEPHNAETLVAEGSVVASAVLRALSDSDVQDLLSDLAREHLIEPEWATSAGSWLGTIVTGEAHHGAVNLAVDSIASWLAANERSFDGLVSRRLPSWVPSLAAKLVDEAVHREALKFVHAVQADPQHPARLALDGYLARLADNLKHDPETRAKLEGAKSAVFDSPRVQALAADVWNTAKAGLLASLADPESGLRKRAVEAVQDIGERLERDPGLQRRVDTWVSDAATFLVDRYRHDIASIITDTIERWDATETTEKIELMVGKDLQYIRLNGTVIGALAGVTIYFVATIFMSGV